MKHLMLKAFWVVLAIVVIGTIIMPQDAEARKRKRIVIDEAIEVRAKIIRPEMELILQRSKMNYDALKLKESFLPRIIRSVTQEPF